MATEIITRTHLLEPGTTTTNATNGERRKSKAFLFQFAL